MTSYLLALECVDWSVSVPVSVYSAVRLWLWLYVCGYGCGCDCVCVCSCAIIGLAVARGFRTKLPRDTVRHRGRNPMACGRSGLKLLATACQRFFFANLRTSDRFEIYCAQKLRFPLRQTNVIQAGQRLISSLING